MRRRLRNLLSWLLVAVVGTICVAVVGEWFIEVAEDKGWYSNAGQTWDGAMSAVLSFLSQPIFYVPFTASAGIVGGLWLDTALRTYEERRSKPKEIDWVFLETEIAKVQRFVAYDIGRKDDIPEGYTAISQESVTAFYALLFYLYHRGLAP